MTNRTRAQAQAAPERLPARSDVVVIGAGIVGICIAYELARRQRQVLIVDRGLAADGNSTGIAGHIVPSHVIPLAAPGVIRSTAAGILRRTGPVTLSWRWRPDYLTWILAFARNCREKAAKAAIPTLDQLGRLSAELADRWIGDENLECSFRRAGLLDVYFDSKAFAGALAKVHLIEQTGVSVEVADRVRVKELEPALSNSAVGGIFFPDDSNLNPRQFLDGLLAATRERGVTVSSWTEVLGIRRSGRAVSTLITSRGDIEVEHVVVAAGVWSTSVAAILGEKLPVQPGKGYSITVERPEQGPNQAMLLGEKHVAVAPMEDRIRFSGWFELGQYDRTPSLQRLRQIEATVRSALSIDAELKVLERWAGLRPTTPDGLPIIGPAPSWDNVTYATGHAMLGLSLGPATGRIVSQLVCGEAPELDLPLCSPARFR